MRTNGSRNELTTIHPAFWRLGRLWRTGTRVAFSGRMAANGTRNVTTPLIVAGLSGSLRRGSFNRSLLIAAKQLAAPRLQIEILGIDDVPPYNQDLDPGGVSKPVTWLRQGVQAADAVLIATPEYSHGVPGVLKNALDWLSRPLQASALEGKPTALMGASLDMTGTARAQDQLRQSLVFTNSPTLLRPELLVARANEKFDADGNLTDPATRQLLVEFLRAFEAWIVCFRALRTDDATSALVQAGG